MRIILSCNKTIADGSAFKTPSKLWCWFLHILSSEADFNDKDEDLDEDELAEDEDEDSEDENDEDQDNNEEEEDEYADDEDEEDNVGEDENDFDEYENALSNPVEKSSDSIRFPFRPRPCPDCH